jgi:Organic solute transporter Ostalpha
MSARNGTTGDLWYWPDGLYMLIPVFFTWILWAVLFFEHVFNLASAHDVALRFQALFTRIILLFPLVATLAYFAAAFPWSNYWIGFVVSCLEAYCLSAFFALLAGLGHIFFSPSDFDKELLNSPWTNRYFIRCGSYFENGDVAFFVAKVSVLQILIVKPLVNLGKAILSTVTSKPPSGAMIFLRVIDVISMISAIVYILRLYRCFAQASGSPLEGHNVLWKFMVVKLLFLFLVVKSILISPLVDAGVIPVDAWICPSDAYDQPNSTRYCQGRLEWVILIFEIVVLTIPACFSYRHHGLHKLDQDRRGNIPHFLYQTFINFVDLGEFINGKIVNEDLKDASGPEERQGLLDEITME